jgi:hypothetical protein
VEVVLEALWDAIVEHSALFGGAGLVILIVLAAGILITVGVVVLVVALLVVGARRRREFASRTELEGIVLDSGTVRMVCRSAGRAISAPNRLVLTPHALALVMTCDRFENAALHRVRAWSEGHTLKLRIAPDPKVPIHEVESADVPVPDAGRWLEALAARGARIGQAASDAESRRGERPGAGT